MRRAFIAVPFVLLVSTALPAFNSVAHVRSQAGVLEPKASVGLKPLTEMTANDRYKGEDGGLYGGVCLGADPPDNRARLPHGPDPGARPVRRDVRALVLGSRVGAPRLLAGPARARAR